MGFAQSTGQAYENAKRYYKAAGLPLGFVAFVGFFLIIASLSGLAAAFIVSAAPTYAGENTVAIAFAAFLAVASLVIAIPVSIRSSRLKAVEDNLPDALKHMAIVLKSGGTVEVALEEASKSDYGPLSKELRNALDRMKKGLTFEDAMHDAAIESGSALFERIAIIVTDAKKAGAGVADVMQAIAEDVKEITRIKRERESRTTTHSLFLYLSVLLLSPFIFGFTLNIVSYISSGITCAVPGSTQSSIAFLNNLLTLFLAFLAAAAAVAIGLIREANAVKYAVRAPIMVLISLAVFEFGKRAGLLLLGGTPQC